jgi:DNA-directed RNA polymerase specialized sigma24 family protein
LNDDEAYATPDEFQSLFARDMTDLFRLSLHLTADAEKAESCLILAMGDCFSNRAVAKKWAPIWARRMVVCNAIRIVFGTKDTAPDDGAREARPEFPFYPSEGRTEALRESLEILELPDLDRLVFVICVLEQYSIMDCALLLSRSPKEVNAARIRAIDRVSLPSFGQIEIAAFELSEATEDVDQKIQKMSDVIDHANRGTQVSGQACSDRSCVANNLQEAISPLRRE